MRHPPSQPSGLLAGLPQPAGTCSARGPARLVSSAACPMAQLPRPHTPATTADRRGSPVSFPLPHVASSSASRRLLCSTLSHPTLLPPATRAFPTPRQTAEGAPLPFPRPCLSPQLAAAPAAACFCSRHACGRISPVGHRETLSPRALHDRGSDVILFDACRVSVARTPMITAVPRAQASKP